jgi:hypothetical protein
MAFDKLFTIVFRLRDSSTPSNVSNSLMTLSRIIACVAIFLGLACGLSGLAETRAGAKEEFVGSIPGDDLSRAFVGGMATNVPVHCITWRLTLSTNQNAGASARFTLSATYGLQGKTDPNQLEAGPTVEVQGEWEIVRGMKAKPDAVVYRLHGDERKESVSLVQAGKNILHFLDEDKNLRVGNAGWSYTLNRTGVPLPQAAAPAAEVTNAVASSSSTNFWRTTPRSGPNVHGYYEGRSPCQEISRLLGVSTSDDCIKVKWQLILYRDPVTHVPTTFALGGLAWRNPPKTGKWFIVKGTKENPDAEVYQLDTEDQNGFLSFLKADDNILFFLDQNRELLVGNEQFSYTLNRATGK